MDAFVPVRTATQREAARLLAQQHPEASSFLDGAGSTGCLRLAHVTVVPPASLGPSDVLEQIKRCVVAAQSHQECAESSQWLASVPRCLRHDVAAVVQYLCMVVAIDFRHWAEKPHLVPGATDAVTRLAAPGEKVETFSGFYVAVTDPDVSGITTNKDTHSATLLYPEQRRPAAAESKRTFLRGSAAMIHLLREAVDVHGLHWYDPAFLRRFESVEDATEALQRCFLGCEVDGVTPMWMPATPERVTLLLALRDALLSTQTSFYTLLIRCDGRVFGHPHAFVPQLRALHPRYEDVVRAPEIFGDDRLFAILKLSQLTALALNEALPALWCTQASTGDSAAHAQLDPPCAWLQTAREASASRSRSKAAQALFADADLISICCDYQIPKALRAAGLLRYDEHLADMVDDHTLLAPGSLEEAAIRVATLVSTEWLVHWLNQGVNGTTGGPGPVTVTRLDHALWYVGRYMTDDTAKHHLCRTIMY